ncbi:MAG: hypothetical protein HY717_13125 [Planctomycetes bacterium]|nr:hypothetical protein [Planctomycetota bacterium]
MIFCTFPLPAQEDSQRLAVSPEDIVQLVQEVEKSHADRPAVLGGVDPRSASPEVRKIAAVLRSTKVDLTLEGQKVEDALELLRQISGLNFVISAKARQAMAEEPPKVQLTVRDLPLENALNLIALNLEDYRFTIGYGAILFVHKEEHRPRKVLRIYPISDLVRPLPDFPAPPLALTSPDEKR